MDRSFACVEAEHKATVATSIFGIIFYDLPIKYDPTYISRRYHAIWPRHLSNRVREKQNPFIRRRSNYFYYIRFVNHSPWFVVISRPLSACKFYPPLSACRRSLGRR